MAPHSSTLAWRIPWAEEPGGLQSMGSVGVGHDWATSLSLSAFMHWRRQWQLTPVFLPGESQGQGAWSAAVHGVTQSRTRLKWLSIWRYNKIFYFKKHKLLQNWKLIYTIIDKYHSSHSVQFSPSVVSDSLRLHGPQYTNPPCPSPTPRVYSNLCPLSLWCHPTISSSVIPFSSRLQSFPASGSFQMSQFFELGGQSIGVSPSASVLPMNIQDYFPYGWTVWISLQSKGLSRVFFNSTVQTHQFFSIQLSL